MKIYTLNQNGLYQLKNILLTHHKQFINDPSTLTEDKLSAWATDVENHLNDDSGAFIEITHFDNVSGCTQTYSISQGGFDFEDIST